MDTNTLEATWLRFQGPDGKPITISAITDAHILFLGSETYVPTPEEIARFREILAQVNPLVTVQSANASTAARSDGIPVLNHKQRVLGFLTRAPRVLTPPAPAPAPAPAPLPAPPPPVEVKPPPAPVPAPLPPPPVAKKTPPTEPEPVKKAAKKTAPLPAVMTTKKVKGKR